MKARVQDLVAGPNRTPGSLQDVVLMERFWFTGDLPFAPVGTLSGGERRRLQLLLVLARRPNVLFLDEPTNDLDLDTIRILEEFLEEWPGALVVVSHDRTFLERTTDRLLGVEPSGLVTPVLGGLDEFVTRVGRPEAQRGAQRSGATLEKPGREARGRSASTIYRELRDTEKELAASSECASSSKRLSTMRQIMSSSPGSERHSARRRPRARRKRAPLAGAQRGVRATRLAPPEMVSITVGATNDNRVIERANSPDDPVNVDDLLDLEAQARLPSLRRPTSSAAGAAAPAGSASCFAARFSFTVRAGFFAVDLRGDLSAVGLPHFEREIRWGGRCSLACPFVPA